MRLLTTTQPARSAAVRLFVYVTEYDNADIVAISLTDGTVERPAAGTLTTAPAGGTIFTAVGLCGVGRYLYASAHLMADEASQALGLGQGRLSLVITISAGMSY